MRVAVLIGAGASYGAGEVFNKRPPLGWALFSELAQSYPDTWGEAPEEKFSAGFEQGMAEMWRTGSPRLMPMLLHMGLYFTQFRMVNQQANAYVHLLHLLRDNNLLGSATFASLNYETLFEQSAESLGLGIHPAPAKNHPNCIPVLKPHGSSNYFPAANIILDNSTMSYTDTYYDSDIVVEDRAAALRRYSWNFPPAMSLYAQGKDSPVGRSFLAAVRNQWRIAAMAADVIITVGVHPNAADGHVWAPILRGSRSPVWYIGGRSPEQPYFEAAAALGPRLVHVADRFDQGLVELARKLKKEQPAGSRARARR